MMKCPRAKPAGSAAPGGSVGGSGTEGESLRRGTKQYRNIRKLIEFFSRELEEARRARGESGLHVLISREEPARFVLNDPLKDAAAEMGMGAAEADAAFLLAVHARLIDVSFGSSSPYGTTTTPFVTQITPEGLTMLES
jgi:hypothetical protein